jgi:hypothetical protein
MAIQRKEEEKLTAKCIFKILTFSNGHREWEMTMFVGSILVFTLFLQQIERKQSSDFNPVEEYQGKQQKLIISHNAVFKEILLSI